MAEIILGLVLNTVLIDLLARGIGRLATLHIETRLAGAFTILALIYLLLSGGTVSTTFTVTMIATSALGALLILSRYRKAARRLAAKKAQAENSSV